MSASGFELPPSFVRKKAKIIADLSVPTEEYHDLSPKDSIDVGIRELIDEINVCEGLVTLSSCAGRVSVFLEGIKKSSGSRDADHNNVRELEDGDANGKDSKINLAAAGGKGGGGNWLFVSHDVLDEKIALKDPLGFLGMDELVDSCDIDFTADRLIHFKFEPMILHIFTASLSHAQTVLTAAFGAGFRESGAMSILASAAGLNDIETPVIAVRSTGYSLDSIVGSVDARTGKKQCCVSEDLLRGLIQISTERFRENEKRIKRFQSLLREGVRKLTIETVKLNPEGQVWEDSETRRQRKKAEGIQRSRKLALERQKLQIDFQDEPQD